VHTIFSLLLWFGSSFFPPFSEVSSFGAFQPVFNYFPLTPPLSIWLFHFFVPVHSLIAHFVGGIIPKPPPTFCDLVPFLPAQVWKFQVLYRVPTPPAGRFSPMFFSPAGSFDWKGLAFSPPFLRSGPFFFFSTTFLTGPAFSSLNLLNVPPWRAPLFLSVLPLFFLHSGTFDHQ